MNNQIYKWEGNRMHNLPEWKISHEGEMTTIRFSLTGIHICDVSYDNVDNRTVRFYTDDIDFDMLETVIQIANDKMHTSTP